MIIIMHQQHAGCARRSGSPRPSLRPAVCAMAYYFFVSSFFFFFFFLKIFFFFFFFFFFFSQVFLFLLLLFSSFFFSLFLADVAGVAGAHDRRRADVLLQPADGRVVVGRAGGASVGRGQGCRCVVFCFFWFLVFGFFFSIIIIIAPPALLLPHSRKKSGYVCCF
jgi:hypothetical protein